MRTDRDPLDPVLAERISQAPTLWRLACDLLSFWSEAGVPTAANESSDDGRYSVWTAVVEQTEDLFAGDRTFDQITSEDRSALARLIVGAPSKPDAAHAAAWGLSVVAGHTFFPAWREELGPDPVALEAGDMYPVADAPWVLREGLELSSRPASLSSPRAGELPTIRMHDGSFVVTVDTSLERWLEAVAVDLTEAAAAHANEHWLELDIPDGELVFPVAPADPELQCTHLMELLEDVCVAEVPVTVFPELCVTSDQIELMAPRVEGFEHPALVVAGTCHTIVNGEPENVAVGLLAGTKRRMTQAKNVPFTDEVGHRRPSKEGIRSHSPLSLSVYPADRYRFGIAICRDLLDHRVQEAYDRMGVNVLLVPAFSEKTGPFRLAVGARVADAQALTIVVNGPLNGPAGQPLRPAIVVGQPVMDEEVVEPPTSGARGVTVFQLPFATDDD